MLESLRKSKAKVIPLETKEKRGLKDLAQVTPAASLRYSQVCDRLDLRF